MTASDRRPACGRESRLAIRGLVHQSVAVVGLTSVGAVAGRVLVRSY